MPATASADPAVLHQLATGYWASAVLLAANELGVFAALADGAATADEVAAARGLDRRATAMLLDACAALGLLGKRDDRYHLGPLAGYLVPGRPGCLAGAFRWLAEQYGHWGRLSDAVRDGAPVAPPAGHLGDDPDRTRAFVLAMHERAVGVARGVVPCLDLAGCRSLLDVGGGPGTYAALLAEAHPDLRVAVLDLPGVCAVARDLLAASPARDRIELVPADATQGRYGTACHDAVLFSGVLHQMAPGAIRAMFAAAHRALRPAGRVFVCDLMLDATRTRPAFSALFSLQMLLTSRDGAAFAVGDCVAWLAEAGFTTAEVVPLPPGLPYTLVRASK